MELRQRRHNNDADVRGGFVVFPNCQKDRELCTIFSRVEEKTALTRYATPRFSVLHNDGDV